MNDNLLDLGDTNKEVSDRNLKVFADPDAPRTNGSKNDSEGVAFEYEVLADTNGTGHQLAASRRGIKLIDCFFFFAAAGVQALPEAIRRLVERG